MNLSILLKNTAETYYWMGFLLADGHFSKSDRLGIALSKKDRGHLCKLASYLGKIKVKENSKSYYFQVQNKKVIGEVKKNLI